MVRAALIAILLFGMAIGSPRAHATGRDVKSVLTASAYGLGLGTVLGVAATPFTRDIRSVFIGSSVGLYLGMIVGIYYVINRDDPGNPLRSEVMPDVPALMPSRVLAYKEPALLEFNYPVARF